MSSRAISWGSPVILVVLAVGLLGAIGAATFLWFEVDRLDGLITDLGARDTELARSISGVERQITQHDLALAQFSVALDAETSSLRREVRQVSDLVSALDFALLDLTDFTEQRFVDIGRCLYHEAELHRYSYYYEVDFAGRYVTGCD